ncbi:hypothetical protein KEM48_010261 [Puccinia striiformis f. sp. tritici PST-130]|nr:hypothetical protein KEM48_010261 [Puccinia striiformis f. sp. tritici PST-130]
MFEPLPSSIASGLNPHLPYSSTLIAEVLAKMKTGQQEQPARNGQEADRGKQKMESEAFTSLSHRTLSTQHRLSHQACCPTMDLAVLTSPSHWESLRPIGAQP